MKGTQRRTIRKEKNNSAGFTLIEMIVTVAIIAIFSGVVVTLITTGSSLFRGVSGNTKSQVKAQETLDEIEDLIIDANRSIYYAYGSGTDMGTQITSDIDDSNAASKTFIACNEYENGDGTSRYVFDVLDWVGSEGKLYYSQREYTKASSNTEEENENGTGDNSENQQTVDTSGISAESMDNGVAVFASADNDSGNGVVSGGSSDKAKDSKELIARSVFAEGIENFTADVTKVESERIVRFRLTTEENGKKVKTLHTVNLRNRIQVMKPDDAFATASSTDVRINIVGAPDSIDAGKSKILGYNLTGNGSIDPTTLKWEVVDGTEKGYFPELDPTYGKLTINDNATGIVTVIVSAETSDGKQRVTSAPVTIKINNTKTVTGIYTDDKTDLLVAAGYSGLNLSSVISWRYTYSDGTKGKDVVPVTWTIGDNCSYASVSSEGQITVDKGAGTAADNGSFTVTATNSENNVSGQVRVNIARIDITDPENDDSIFNVGDDKKLEYIYKEGGNPVSIPEADAVVSTVSKPGNAEDYTTTGQFADGDIGKWEVKRTVDLAAKREGYGTTESIRKFEVVKKNDCDIIITDDMAYDTVVAGMTYTCGPTAGWGFNFFPSGLYSQSNSVINWSLKGSPTGVSIRNYKKDGHLMWAELTVESFKANDISEEAFIPSGFVLCADYTATDNNGNEIKMHGERAINVAYGINIITESNYVYQGNSYSLGPELLISRQDGSLSSRILSCNDKDVYIHWSGKGRETEGNIVSENIKENADDGKWYFTPPENGLDRSVKITAGFRRVYGVFPNDNTAVHFEDSISVEIKDPVSVNVYETETKKELQKFKNISTTFTIEVAEEVSSNYTIDWTCYGNGEKIIQGNTLTYIPAKFENSISFQTVITIQGNAKTFKRSMEVTFDDEIHKKIW